MSRLQSAVGGLGGLAATHELYALGFGRRAIANAVRSGELRRARQGWYAHPDLHSELFKSARVGGLATCLSAARYWALWIPEDDHLLHVAVHRAACQLRDPANPKRRLEPGPQIIHWTDERDVTAHSEDSRLLRSPVDALVDAVKCQGIETGFVLVESALRKGVLSRLSLAALLCQLDAGARLQLSAAGVLSDSGLESLFVFRMRRVGVSVRQQVWIGRDRVDVLIGDRLVVELDSREFHDADADSRRDARLLALGYQVIRVRYRQIMFDWSSVQAAILAAL
jgi:very-short-patch-repair endonuclease